MHHFLYPTKDTFITNRGDYSNKNFGVDEILGVGTKNKAVNIWQDTKDYNYNSSYVSGLSVTDFYGTASATSFSGTSSFISGSIVSSGSIISFKTPFFSGSLVASINGTETGSSIISFVFSGSLTAFSGTILTYTSASGTSEGYTGSWDSASVAWDVWDAYWNYNAIIVESVGLITGFASGSVIADCQKFFTYNGVIQDLDGVIHYGILTGKQTKQERNLVHTYKKYPNRSLLQFNINAISASIALPTSSADRIPTPEFKLNLRVAKEEELQTTYKVYAFPVNQSWEMGNGYYYDGGSDVGCSWDYKDYDDGTYWYPITDTASLTPIDFVTYPERASGSWARGGGTWYTNSAYICSQSFDYETSDIVMDISPIVRGWLSGSISNYGVILISSDEFSSTGSQFDLSFFSRDTNTIYSPYLDAGWTDQSWTTGSVTLTNTIHNVSSGSVSWHIVEGYLLSGSTNIVTGSAGINISASLSGSFGLCQPATIVGGTISGEVTATATSGPFIGSIITGNVYGATLSSSISGSFTSGQLVGCGFTGSSSPFWTGYISGSTFLVNATGSYRLSGSQIVGTANDQYQVVGTIGGFIVAGTITGSHYSSSQFLGQIQSGWAAGYYISASISGTYATSSANTASYYTSRSLEEMQTNQPFAVVVQNLPPTVKSNNIIRINVFGREEFPLKSFTRATQLTQFITPKYLPTSSYYALKDNETEQIVLDFDNYSKISCDENGNYFLLDTSCLPQERYFRVLIKVEQSGSIYTLDHGNVFKVVR